MPLHGACRVQLVFDREDATPQGADAPLRAGQVTRGQAQVIAYCLERVGGHSRRDESVGQNGGALMPCFASVFRTVLT
jgi:hypothetical protein